MSVAGHFECCCCEVFVNKTQLKIVCVNSPPSRDSDIFIDKVEELLSIYCKNNIVFIAGDFNIDFLDGSAKKTVDFIGLLKSYRFEFVVKEHTRVTRESKTCVDNIITNLEGDMFTEVREFHISDHKSQKLTFCLITTNIPKQLEKRVFSDDNIFFLLKC